MSANRSEQSSAIDLRVIDPSTTGAGRPANSWLQKRAAALLTATLPPDQRDDRFDGWEPPLDLVAVVATMGAGNDDEEAVAYLGGSVDRGRLQLDGLMAADRAEGSEGAMLAAALYRAIDRSVRSSGADVVELWGRPALGWHRALAAAEGFTELRALHQLRCSLPLDSPILETRAFVPGEDDERLLRVNNRAFADHPDQGNLTTADLEGAATQPWFDPEGIRLYPDPADPEVLAGFCWTKIHQPLADGEPALGEIYAIGVDPDHHGKGLGAPMTASGLAWLADQGLTTGMLYVEADNEPALRTYEKLGFRRHRTDRAWHKPVR